MKTLKEPARLTRVRDLEHHCRCYVNAYIQQLEGRKSGSNLHTPEEMAAREWGVLLDLMFCVLVQEGRIEKLEEESDEEDRDDPVEGEA